MSAERDAMIESLKKYVIPHLREKGFKGTFPHFYRKSKHQLELLMFQFSMWGGTLYVEISKCSPEGYRDDITGELRPPNRLKVYQIGGGSPFNRTRIGKETNAAFQFNRENSDEVAQQIKQSLSEAEQWWLSYPNWWSK
ncbi:DUF4304 domain-containing protein [Planococcus sp. 1R117A]|uniref:DUF4304 domain-containing protein n=1 Tax=Planococcus sp. 1R117A TaxID=3447020 RepID=UPI003EDC62F5